jgi:plastocyanin domain-containing protein
MNKIFLSIIVALSLIAIGFMFTRKPAGNGEVNTPQNYNVSQNNGTQIIELKAKGGYTPRVTLAKAGIPTILRMNTNGTFDCSSSIRIPSLGISKNLPQTGLTDIDLGIQKAGTFQGSCGMGMYPFEIRFE